MEALKKLAVVAGWIVFVMGCILLIFGFISLARPFGGPAGAVGCFAVGVISLTLSACIAKLRQMLE